MGHDQDAQTHIVEDGNPVLTSGAAGNHYVDVLSSLW